MIEKISYSDMLDISKELDQSAKTVAEIANNKGLEELSDFISTVEGYSKYLATTVELYQEADDAISSLNTQK